MMGSIRHQIRIDRAPDVVWELAGDPARLHEWFPGIVSCRVDGTSRVVTLGSGLSLPEEIVVNDATQRRFQYRVTAPLFAYHRGTLDVIDLDDGTSLAVYATDADPRAMALMIGAAARSALAELKRRMELDHTARDA
jgi:hypothetical protein